MQVLGYIAGFIATFIVLVLLFAFPFMWLWNYAVVSAVSVAQPITYWVALCLMTFLSAFVASSRSSSSSK